MVFSISICRSPNFPSQRLWHEHGIQMHPVLDLQLVRIHAKKFGNVMAQSSIRLEGMGKAFTDLPVKETGFNFNLFTHGSLPIPSSANNGSTKQN